MTPWDLTSCMIMLLNSKTVAILISYKALSTRHKHFESYTIPILKLVQKLPCRLQYRVLTFRNVKCHLKYGVSSNNLCFCNVPCSRGQPSPHNAVKTLELMLYGRTRLKCCWPVVPAARKNDLRERGHETKTVMVRYKNRLTIFPVCTLLAWTKTMSEI